MNNYIYINHSLRFRIDDAPFPHENGVYAELQEKVTVLFLSRWISKDSRILSISEDMEGNTPVIANNYDGTVTEVWPEERFNLKDRLKDIAQQYVDSITSEELELRHAAAGF